MKDKLRLVDVSMLSSYMGRALTVVVTIFVVGVAVSALLTNGGPERGVIRVCVPVRSYPGEAVEAYEPFRTLLSRETHRPVELVECMEEWPEGSDLYVMPMDKYIRHASDLDVLAVYEIKSSDRRSDAAVIITRSSDEDVDYADVSPHEVAFSHPLSVNGFWLQAAAMVTAGFEMPDDARELRFAGLPREGGRVIYGVLFGAYLLGACKLSEIVELTDRGIIDAGDLQVIHKDDVLPELVLAVRRHQSRYYRGKIEAMARLLNSPTSRTRRNDSARLLQSYGVCRLEPLGQDSLEKAAALYSRFGATTQIVSP